jgi:radical SAM-linked protein
MDIDLARGVDPSMISENLNKVFPSGFRIVAAEEIPLKSPSLSVIIAAVRYRVTLQGLAGLDLQQKTAEFLQMDSYLWIRQKRGKVTELDLRRELQELNACGSTLEMVIARGKPIEFASAITGLPLEQLKDTCIEKIEVIFSDSIS